MRLVSTHDERMTDNSPKYFESFYNTEVEVVQTNRRTRLSWCCLRGWWAPVPSVPRKSPHLGIYFTLLLAPQRPSLLRKHRIPSESSVVRFCSYDA